MRYLKVTNIASDGAEDSGYVVDINEFETAHLFRGNPSYICKAGIAAIDRLQELEDELAIAIDIIEESGVDYDEIKEGRS